MRDGDARLEALLSIAVQQDPSLDRKAGLVILRACLEEAAADPQADASAVARRCLARFPAADASWVAHLARAAVSSA